MPCSGHEVLMLGLQAFELFSTYVPCRHASEVLVLRLQPLVFQLRFPNQRIST